MKYLLLIVLIATGFSSVRSQAVTLIMKDSTTHVGYVIKEDSSRIKFSSPDYPTYKWFNKDEILNYTSIPKPLAFNLPKEGIYDEIQMEAYSKLPSTNFKRAGAFGLTSVCFILGGGIAGIIGALKKSPTALYIGAGVSGAGFVFLIPTFANLHIGGKKLEDKGL